MPEQNLKLDPTHIEYWVAEAQKLKQAADLCWEADLNLKQNSESAKLYGLDQALIETADDAESELSWLYPNLVAFAIQHLAIGILLKRDPQHIIDEAPRFQIINAVQYCGVSIDEELREIISNVENAFRWSEKSPQWGVRLSAEQVKILKRKKAYFDAITERNKKAFDELFNKLNRMAHDEMAAKTSTDGAVNKEGSQ
ncbi:MAG: hypothetical protein AMJ53_11165 [Gammaproteobacteria bacterium SG8_11]|nr:MAG: hypothetical protein AMJ53_11165 [Gammaproteobacteria bacterium SG8_11]